MTQHNSKTPQEAKDLWATPQWLFNWLDNYYHFKLDVAASSENAKVNNFLTEQNNAIGKNWNQLSYHSYSFCNPTYSNLGVWVREAIRQLDDHRSSSVYVIPTPNGESYYKEIFDHASKITYINGRIAFESSCDYIKTSKDGKVTHIKKGDAVSGNTRGTCVVEFSPNFARNSLQIFNIDRDELIDRFS